MNRRALSPDVSVPTLLALTANRNKMSFSTQQSGLFASFRRLRASSWIFAAALAGAMAIPGAAEAMSARRAGGYDGVWNVLIITQVGHCDAAYSYPFQVARGRISSAGAATVS